MMFHILDKSEVGWTCLTPKEHEKKMLYSGILVFLLVWSFGNIHSQSLEKIQVKIEEMNTKMADAMVKGDYSASIGMYADDAYSLPSYFPMIKGIEAIKNLNMEMADSPMNITSFEPMIEEIIPGGDLYVEAGKYKMTGGNKGRAGAYHRSRQVYHDMGKATRQIVKDYSRYMEFGYQSLESGRVLKRSCRNS
jgi:ketosteroid isomerase-like protein